MRIEGPTHPAAASAAGPAPVQAVLWRQALEQAMWQARLRLEPELPAPMSAAPPGDQPTAGERDRPVHAPQDTWAPDGAGPPRAAGKSTGQVSSRLPPDRAAAGNLPDAPPLRDPAPPAPIVRAAAAGAPAPLPSPDRQPGSAARPSAPAVRLPAPADSPAWPPFASQASLQGSKVSASLRDARLGDGEALVMRRALARHLSRSGLELGELLVNGRPVVDNPRS